MPADQLTHVHQFHRPAYQDAAVSKFLAELAPGTYEGLYNL
jgi:tripeptidyl-peptidase-1